MSGYKGAEPPVKTVSQESMSKTAKEHLHRELAATQRKIRQANGQLAKLEETEKARVLASNLDIATKKELVAKLNKELADLRNRIASETKYYDERKAEWEREIQTAIERKQGIEADTEKEKLDLSDQFSEVGAQRHENESTRTALAAQTAQIKERWKEIARSESHLKDLQESCTKLEANLEYRKANLEDLIKENQRLIEESKKAKAEAQVVIQGAEAKLKELQIATEERQKFDTAVKANDERSAALDAEAARLQEEENRLSTWNRSLQQFNATLTHRERAIKQAEKGIAEED